MSDATTASGPPTITTQADGPFTVDGSVTVRSAMPVVSENGEPMTWKPGEADVVDSPALCRCGASANKPFCDGSHADADWDPADGFPIDSTTAERRKAITGPEVSEASLTVFDDPMLCMHAGFCGTAKSNVWEMMEQSDDAGVRATVMRMVEKCPSGRLVNQVDGEEIEPSLPVEIGVVPDGPLWVTGMVPITGASGDTLETRNRVTLCRCGASSLKPLCDGTHADIGFSTSDNT